MQLYNVNRWGSSVKMDGWDAPLIAVRQGELCGLLNADGKELISPDYNAIFYSEEITLVGKGRQIGVFSSSSKIQKETP